MLHLLLPLAVAASPPSLIVQGPAELAAASGPGLPGGRVVHLGEAEDGSLWAVSLHGGVGRWDGETWTRWTRADGLPHDRTLAVAPDALGAWVATAQGLVRIRGRQVAEIYTTVQGLPDDYTQAVAVDGPTVWVGTYRGLARVDGQQVRAVLRPWSVFSLVRGPDRRMWVGYGGLQGLPQAEPIEGVDGDWRIFDVLPLKRGMWLAAVEQGLIWLHEGVATHRWRPPGGGGVYALAAEGDTLWIATAEEGLWRLPGGATTTEVGSEPEPLPVPLGTVDSLWPARDGGVWVGGREGVLHLREGAVALLPATPLPAGRPIHDLHPHRGGLAVAHEGGITWLGERPPRGLQALAEAAGPRIHRLDRRGRRWLAEGEAGAFALRGSRVRAARPRPASVPDWRIEAGRVHRGDWSTTEVPFPHQVVPAPGGAWAVGETGAYRIEGRQVRHVSAGWGTGPLHRVAAWGDEAWAASEDGRIWHLPHGATVDLSRWHEGLEVRVLVTGAEGAWVGTSHGLFRIRPAP